MCKQISMSIHQFMEVERGNTTFKQIYKDSLNNNSKTTSYKDYLKNCRTILSMVFVFGLPTQISVQQTNIEIVEETFKVLYVITAVGAKCIYDIVVGVALAV